LLIRVVVDPVLNEDMPDQVKLEEDLFEPELVDLVDDDEQHLIITFFQ
jgi:hypothetical protein